MINQLHMIGGALAEGEDRIKGMKYSIFAEISYFSDNTKKMEILKKYGKINWDIIPDLTTLDASTFRNRITGEVIVAIRGTDVSNVSDLLTDLAVIGGVSKFTPRADVVNNIVSRAIQRYGKQSVIVVGHSLGGKLATISANKFGLQAYIFNSASSPLDIFERKNQNIHSYSTNYNNNRDIVSWFGSLFNKHKQFEFNPSQMSAHTNANFLPQTPEDIALTGQGLKRYIMRKKRLLH